tara:strand:- start:1574 stop:2317 length:744 start_codon:yes stop_codon:yes gene_type:complete
MTLDDTVREEIRKFGSNTERFKDFATDIVQGKTPEYTSEDGIAIAEYNQRGAPLTDEEKRQIQRTPDRELANAVNGEPLINALGFTSSILAGIVSSNYQEVINEMNSETLANAALESPGVEIEGNDEHNMKASLSNNYKVWRQAEETKNTQAYLNNVNNPVLASIVSLATESEILELIGGRKRITQATFLKYFADEEGNLDENNLRAYLTETEANAPEENNVKAGVYLQTGIAYSKQAPAEEEAQAA